jgi:hypothetical protein
MRERAGWAWGAAKERKEHKRVFRRCGKAAGAVGLMILFIVIGGIICGLREESFPRWVRSRFGKSWAKIRQKGHKHWLELMLGAAGWLSTSILKKGKRVNEKICGRDPWGKRRLKNEFHRLRTPNGLRLGHEVKSNDITVGRGRPATKIASTTGFR